MSKKFKKIKGGLDISFVDKIKNLKSLNNLKSFYNLDTLGVLVKKDNDYFFKYDEELLDDPISKEEIKYEQAFLLDQEIFDINTLYYYVVSSNNNLNPITKKNISELNKNKIRIFYYNILSDSSSFNNLKSLEELKKLGFIDEEEYLLDRNKNKIKDPILKRPIKYKDAILIDGVLYDADNLLRNLNTYFTFKISIYDIKKIKSFRFNVSEIVDLKNPNNLKSLEDLKKLGFIDEGEYFVDRHKNRIKDPISKTSFKYNETILIDGLLYDADNLLRKLFTDKTINVKDNDIKKIKSFKIDIDKIADLKNPNNLKSLEELKELEFIDEEGYFVDRHKNRIIDFMFEIINYRDAMLIDGVLYNIKELVERVYKEKRLTTYSSQRISNIDLRKIKSFRESEDEIKGYGENGHILDSKGLRIFDPYSRKGIKKDKAILINGVFYDIDLLYDRTFNLHQYEDFYGEIISVRDIIKIYNRYNPEPKKVEDLVKESGNIKKKINEIRRILDDEDLNSGDNIEILGNMLKELLNILKKMEKTCNSVILFSNEITLMALKIYTRSLIYVLKCFCDCCLNITNISLLNEIINNIQFLLRNIGIYLYYIYEVYLELQQEPSFKDGLKKILEIGNNSLKKCSDIYDLLLYEKEAMEEEYYKKLLENYLTSLKLVLDIYFDFAFNLDITKLTDKSLDIAKKVDDIYLKSMTIQKEMFERLSVGDKISEFMEDIKQLTPENENDIKEKFKDLKDFVENIYLRVLHIKNPELKVLDIYLNVLIDVLICSYKYYLALFNLFGENDETNQLLSYISKLLIDIDEYKNLIEEVFKIKMEKGDKLIEKSSIIYNLVQKANDLLISSENEKLETIYKKLLENYYKLLELALQVYKSSMSSSKSKSRKLNEEFDKIYDEANKNYKRFLVEHI